MTGSLAVRIVPQALAHAEGLYAALQDPRIYAFLDETAPQSVMKMRAVIARRAKGAPAGSGQVWLNWTVFAGGNVVGYTQATLTDDGSARLAYVLAPTVWGRSVAYAACLLTIAELDALPAVTEIRADTARGNLRSQALLGRLGFQPSHASGDDLFYCRVQPASDTVAQLSD